jgi:protein tyrosine/serine phosphatase
MTSTDAIGYTQVPKRRYRKLPMSLALIQNSHSLSPQAFMELYTQILDHGGHAFGTIFRHIRDRPNDGFVFHCTAGKDRTGVFAALLLKVS